MDAPFIFQKKAANHSTAYQQQQPLQPVAKKRGPYKKKAA